MHITEDPSVSASQGKAVGGTIWGVGFNNQIKKRAGLDAVPTTDQGLEGRQRMQRDAGNCQRAGAAQDRDALEHPDLHDVLLLADVLSPWSVGRFRDLPGVQDHAQKYWAKGYCLVQSEHDIDYLCQSSFRASAGTI